jgi:putative transposase
MNAVINERASIIPLSRACDALVLNRSTVYHRTKRRTLSEEQRASALSRKHCRQQRALSTTEREAVIKVLNSEEFIDQPPMQVYQTLLERGEYLCSTSTMHRLLRENQQNGERRNQRAAQSHAVPRLRATAPNEVWTWDCSKLRTRVPGVYLTLYVVLDLFSRYALAWMVSRKENAALAMQLMDEATHRYAIMPEQLTIHQDRGSPMIAHRYIDMLNGLGVTLSHSRPRVSNDNPFSEAQFKTMKYQPTYPSGFDNTGHGIQWCDEYFDWYNFSHHHSGLNGYTPEQVFTGRYQEIALQKQTALDARYALNPERFVRGAPKIALPPTNAEINPVTALEIENGVSTDVNFPTLNRVKEKIRLTSN